MKKPLVSIFLIIIFSLLIGCSERNKTEKEKDINDNPKILYTFAMEDLQNRQYEDAIIKFKILNSKFPLSDQALKSQMMIGFIEYMKLNYQEAIYIFDRFIQNYPSHKDLDYAYYMKALCYFEQINSERLDGENNIKALNSFNQVLNRFSKSKYALDSKQKIIAIKENIAAKHMDIGLFYLKYKKYFSAMNRFNKVISEHETSSFVPEALFRLVEIYYKLGMLEDAKKTNALIGYNYPNSKWYNYSLNILDEKKGKNKSFFIKKLSRLLNNNDKKQ